MECEAEFEDLDLDDQLLLAEEEFFELLESEFDDDFSFPEDEDFEVEGLLLSRLASSFCIQ